MNTQSVQTNQVNENSICSQILIKEFKPRFLNKTVLSEDLCKASFEIYKGKTVEFLINPERNMFNATKLISDYNEFKLKFNKSVETTSTVDPQFHKNVWKEVELSSFFRKVKNIHYIDRISYMLFGQLHFMTDSDESIWINGEIKSELKDGSSNVKLSKLQHRQDNIYEFINAPKSIVHGTWLHYEFLPKILALCDEDYEILANHYESLLIPHLANSNTPMKEHVDNFYNSSLLAKAITNLIMSYKSPLVKGKEGEKEVLKQLQANGFKHARLTHKKKCCDIILPKEKVLVEVKAKKRITKDDDRKYIRDLIEQGEDIIFGVFVNIYDTETKTCYAENPKRLYLHPSDFTPPFLQFIKETAHNMINEIENDAEAIKQAKYIPIVKRTEEILADRGYVDLKRVLDAMFARAKIDPDYKTISHLINTEDIKDKEKTDNIIQLSEQMNEIEKSIETFIINHFLEFETGYYVKQCIACLKRYIKSQKLPDTGKKIIVEKLKKYVIEQPDYSHPGSNQTYKLKPEVKELIEQKIKEQNIIIKESNFPSTDEELTNFLKLEEVNNRLNDKGYEYKALAELHNREIEKYKEIYPDLETINYSYNLSERLYDHCIPFNRKDDNTYYIFKTSELGQQIIGIFEAILSEMYFENKRLGYTAFYKEYLKRIDNEYIVKPYSQRLFKELIEKLKVKNKEY